MCTAIILNRAHPSAPVIIAANRDELYERAALPPRLLSEAPRIVGGLDAARGGTWLGLTPSGFLALVTNQRGSAGAPPAPRSRGEVVVEVLRRGGRDEARAYLETLDPTAQNSFNLVFGDAGGLDIAYGRRDAATLTFERIAAGMSVLSNEHIDSPDSPKVARVQALVQPLLAREPPLAELISRLEGVLADHSMPEAVPAAADSDLPPELARRVQALCVHTPSYGTRSSTVVALAPNRVVTYRHADGPPCRTAFRDLTALLGG